MSYPGGKGGDGVYQAIINQMPPHDRYFEPFAGAASILRAKRPATYSLVIDLDGACVEAINATGIPGCTARVLDGLTFMENNPWRETDLVYCDPPYLMSARRQQRRNYRFEFDDQDHRRLLSIVTKMPCMVAVSGYASDLYRETLKDWRLVTFQAATRGRPAIEHLWMNYPEPRQLHDYQYLGKTFRDRERIKRKAERWRRRIAAMDTLERNLVAAAIAEAARIDTGGDRSRATAMTRVGRGSPATTSGPVDDRQARRYRPPTPGTAICRKDQGWAEPGNSCLETLGTCESCPHWVGPAAASSEASRLGSGRGETSDGVLR